jgi:hypothetical protein
MNFDRQSWDFQLREIEFTILAYGTGPNYWTGILKRNLRLRCTHSVPRHITFKIRVYHGIRSP